jgi:glycosyltransferase involved in cell wall biosynthesis
MLDVIIAANYKINPKIWGGMDEFFLEVTTKLRNDKINVLLVLPHFDDTDESHYKAKGIPYKILYGDFFFLELIKFCRENPSKIIHTHFLPTLARQFISLASLKADIITTEHMPRPYIGWSLEKTIKNKLISRFSQNSISKMIHVSKYLEHENRLVFGHIIDKKSKVIYNGVRLHELKTPSIKSFTSSNKLKLISVGRLVFEKGFSDLIDIVDRLYQQYGDIFELNILGDGPLRDELEKKAQKYLNRNIFFRGYVNNVSEWLRDSDLYVHCASQEAFAFVFLEAFEAGVPVVTYDVGGNSESVIDGFNGFLVDKKDNRDIFVKKIAFFLQNPETLVKYSKNARTLIESSFSLDKMVYSYINLYKSYLNKDLSL